MKTELKNMVTESRRSFRRQYCLLPMKAKNDAQKALMAKHGSPFDFAKACAAAIGEISINEAESAISKYLKQWKEVK